MKRSFTKEWINSIPKIINENGCWIPKKKPIRNGYIRIGINKKYFSLHRVVMCLWYDIDYNDWSIETRHSAKCSRACFFHEHLKPGSASDNTKDSVQAGTHNFANKTACSKCGREYENYKVRTGPRKGRIIRMCSFCKSAWGYANRKVKL